MSDATGGGTKKKDKDKKKKKLVISLWINKTKYNHGCMCTFCGKVTAILHCKECPDFFCHDCDITAHSTKKRESHVRDKLSKLDLKSAAGLLTRYVRLVQHLKNNQKRARQVYRRYYDTKTLCHYYYNGKYGFVTWRKPYCLRLEELFPHYTEDSGASKIQCLYHLWKARVKVTSKLIEFYRKVFDRNKGRFYYTWLGPGQLLPKSNWNAPCHFGRRGYPKDIKPIFTRDAAAVIIQRKWRTILTYRFLWALTRAAYDQIWDPVSGSFTYYHVETETLYREKPKIMGNQPWDPNFVPGWDKQEVFLFLRRIGLKRYAHSFHDYGIDGKALLLLEDEDFDNLNITNKIHRTKVRVELKKRYPYEFRERVSEEMTLRREAIRKFKLFSMASNHIQAVFRGYLARKTVWLMQELVRLEHYEREMNKEIEHSGTWWTDRHEIPTRRMLPYNAANSMGVAELETPETVGVLQKLKGGDKGVSLKLPPIPLKLFGRKRDHKTTKGWGRLDHKHDFQNINISSYLDHRGRGAENFTGTDNISRAYSLRLLKKGYDRRRAAQAGIVDIDWGEEEEEDAVASKEESPAKKEESDEEPDDTFGEEDAKRAKKAKRDEAKAAGLLD
jgi:hypothetical protein